jgi:hypothetical protein
MKFYNLQKLMGAAFLLGAVALTGCSHALHEYHVSDSEKIDFSAKKQTRVTTTKEQFTVMGFIYDTNYVNDAYADLERQCPGHRVTGINTRYSTSHGFLSWTNKVHMTGYCLE